MIAALVRTELRRSWIIVLFALCLSGGLHASAQSPVNTSGRPTVALSPDGKLLVVTDSFGRIAIWDSVTGAVLYTFTGGANHPPVTFSPDSTLVAFCSGIAGISIYDTKFWRLVGSLNAQAVEGGLAFSSDDKTLAVETWNTIQLWDFRTGVNLRSITPHLGNAPISWYLEYSPDGSLLAVCSADAGGGGVVELWGMPSGVLANTIDSPSPIHSLAFSPDGRTLALGRGGWPTPNEDVELWDVVGEKEINTIAQGQAKIVGLAFSSDGSNLTTADTDGSFKLWDVASGRLVDSVEGHGFFVPVSVSADGRVGATPVPGDSVRVCSASSGRFSVSILANGSAVSVAAVPQSPVEPQVSPAGSPTDRLRNDLSGSGPMGPGGLGDLGDRIIADIASGADPNVQGRWGSTALMFFIREGNLDEVKKLIAQHVDINTADVNGNNALTAAASTGNDALIDFLVQNGADVKDSDGLSVVGMRGDRKALTTALLDEYPPPVKSSMPDAFILPPDPWQVAYLLVYFGADANVRNSYGETPIMFATRFETDILVSCLIAHGADVNTRNTHGMTGLENACSSDYTAMVTDLLNHGANPNLEDDFGGAPLIIAAGEGHTDLVNLLLAHGANVDILETSGQDPGRTPLIFAAQEGCLSVVQTLLEHGAAVNAATRDHETALSYAVFAHDATTVSYLLAHGANVNAAPISPFMSPEPVRTLLQADKAEDPTDSYGILQLLKKAGENQ